MKTRITSNWAEEQARAALLQPKTKSIAKTDVKIVALTVLGSAKVQMPVDTGAARARWGIEGAAGGIWQELDDGMTIVQGAGLEKHEYIIELNEGSSQQAPAGFIDAIAYKAEEELINKLVSDLGLL